MKLKTQYTIAALLVVALASSCTLPKKVVKPALPKALPEKYGSLALQDNTTVAHLKIDNFFDDEKLISLIKEVLQHNLENKIAAEHIKIAEAFLLSRKGALFPSINALINGSGTRYGNHTIEGVGNFDTNLSPNISESQKVNTQLTPNYFLGLNVSWEIDIWGKLGAMKQAARARYLATTHGRDWLRSALANQTALLYYELITLDKELEILNKNITLQQKALQVVTIQKSVGRATELAVQQFKAQLANTEAVMFEVKQAILVTENQLLTLCGKFEGRVERSSSIQMGKVNFKSDVGAPKHLLEYRPDVLQSHQELAASHADAKAARAAFFPSLSISAYGAFNAFNTPNLFSPTSMVYQLLGNIVAPVFQQHQLKANFRIANAQQEIAFLNYQNTIIRSYQEVKTTLGNIENTEQIKALKTQEVASLTKALEVANNLYVTAYANYLEIIAAQKSKLEADMALIKTERNQVVAYIQLYKALGGGWKL